MDLIDLFNCVDILNIIIEKNRWKEFKTLMCVSKTILNLLQKNHLNQLILQSKPLNYTRKTRSLDRIFLLIFSIIHDETKLTEWLSHDYIEFFYKSVLECAIRYNIYGCDKIFKYLRHFMCDGFNRNGKYYRSNDDYNAISYLIVKYDNISILQKDYMLDLSDQYSYMSCIKHNSTKCLQYLIENDHAFFFADNFFHTTLRYNRLNILKIFHGYGVVKNISDATIKYIIRLNRFSILKWLIQHQYQIICNKKIIKHCIVHKRINMIKFFYKYRREIFYKKNYRKKLFIASYLKIIIGII